jgi:predicted RND superfamily exporter protein
MPTALLRLIEETLNTLLNNYYKKYGNASFRRIIFTSWLIVTAFFGFQLPKLQADFEFEKFFPNNDPDIVFYEKHLETFDYDNDYIVIVLEDDSTIFQQDFLQACNELAGELRAVPSILNVVNPVEMQQLVKSPIGNASYALFHVDEVEKYHSDSARVFSHPLYNTFFSMDGKSLILQLSHDHLNDPVASQELVAQIQTIANNHHFDNVRLIGKLIAQEEFVGYIQRDFLKYIGLALLVGFIALVLIFRSIQTALMPYLISITSLVWLLGIMSLMNQPITILGSLIPPVILFVSSSDAIHLINAYQKNLGEKKSRLIQSVHQVIFPTMLTSVTTAIGFFSLIAIDTVPIRSLGIFCGIGVLAAFVITFVFGPLILRGSLRTVKAGTLYKNIPIIILRNWKAVALGNLLIVSLSTYGMSLLKVDALLLDDLPEDSNVQQDFAFMDAQMGGSKPWEIAYWPADSTSSIWDEQVMMEAAKIDDYLQSQYPMVRLWSPVTFVKYGNQMIQGGLNEAFQYPNSNDYQKAIRAVKGFTLRGDAPKLIAENQQYARMTGFIPEYGSSETIRRNNELLDFLASNIDQKIIQYQLTGTTFLIDKSHELLSFNLMKGLLIAIGMIGVILGLYFRSFKLLIISLLPNIIPLLITAGYMGFMDISLKLTTSIIFTVAFGIAVDDTIHFIASYRQQKHRTKIYRMIATFKSSGRAIITTTLIILAGFALFLTSSFGATYYLGLFLTLSLSTALLIDLTLLPLLLHFSSNNQPSEELTKHE